MRELRPTRRRHERRSRRTSRSSKYAGDLDDLRGAGFEPLGLCPVTPEGNRIAAGRIPFDRLGQLEAVDHVTRIEGSQAMQPALNHSVPAINADVVHNPPYNLTGAGVAIGIIDWGLDWRHPDFVGADDKSRILGIWDQSLTADGDNGEAPPAAFPGIGVEYTQDQITRALAEDGEVRTTNDKRFPGHGTNVGGIAAGDGSASEWWGDPFTYVGVAPGADLIVVVLDEAPLPGELGSMPSLQHAFDFIFNYFVDHPQVAPRSRDRSARLRELPA